MISKAENPDIICYTEPVIRKNIRKYNNYFSDNDENNRCYVSIYIKREIPNEVIINNNDFILIKIKTRFGAMFIGCIYLNLMNRNKKIIHLKPLKKRYINYS